MPIMHRLSCFRDDIIFFIYIYQWWIYPVDHSRANEFGQGGDDSCDDETDLSIEHHPDTLTVSNHLSEGEDKKSFSDNKALLLSDASTDNCLDVNHEKID